MKLSLEEKQTFEGKNGEGAALAMNIWVGIGNKEILIFANIIIL